MNYNMWKFFLVFFVLFVFTLTSELAAQEPDNIDLTPSICTLKVYSQSQIFTATLTSDGIGVTNETVFFREGWSNIEPGNAVTGATGKAHTTYTLMNIPRLVKMDTLQAMWYSDADTLMDSAFIKIELEPPIWLEVTPNDTAVVVTEEITLVAEMLDSLGNHVDATSTDQVSFTTTGKGTFGTPRLDQENNIEVTYATDDSMARDTITTTLLENGIQAYSRIRTYGAAPDSLDLYVSSSTVITGGHRVYFICRLFDEFGNPSVWSDWYGWETYKVSFAVSEGGGVFEEDEVEVNYYGYCSNYYYSSSVAGVYTVTVTSETVTNEIDITQEPDYDYPASIILTPSPLGILTGTDTTLTASLYDQYGKHCPADDERFEDVVWGYIGEGALGTPYIENHNWKCVYTSDPVDEDSAYVWASYSDTCVDTAFIFSGEPGEFDHFGFCIMLDSARVSNGDINYTNKVRLEGQDIKNIRISTYNNEDPITVSMNESTADSSRVVWFTFSDTITPMDLDTVVGHTAAIPESSFIEGEFFVAIANQVAETVTITATDTADHTGTSPEVTWLPIEVVAFNVGLEDGLTFIWPIDDTVNVEVTAIDTFGNTTDVGLPLNVLLSANRTEVVFLNGETVLMETSVELYLMVATEFMSGLIITVFDISNPNVRGSSYPINVGSGVEEGPIISDINASFGTGAISYVVAKDGQVSIKVYNKVGMEVGSLVDGAVSRGYYQASLKALNLSSDIYFVLMKGPGIDKKIKATLIK